MNNETDIKLGHIYARVSTTKQANEGFSIAAQLAKCRRLAEEKDIRVVGEYVDEGISGTNFKRKELCRMRQIIRPNEFIITYSLSRLGRRAIDTCQLYDEMTKQKITILSINEPFISDQKFGKFIISLMSSIYEMEVDEVTRRTEAIRSEKILNGEQTGTVGFGFALHHYGGRKYIYPIAHEQRGITYAIDQGTKNPKLSWGEIGRQMIQNGWYPKRTEKWSQASLQRLIEGNMKNRTKNEFNNLTYKELENYEKRRIPLNLPKNRIVIDPDTNNLDYRSVYGYRFDKENAEFPTIEDVDRAVKNKEITMNPDMTKLYNNLNVDEEQNIKEEVGKDNAEEEEETTDPETIKKLLSMLKAGKIKIS